MKTKSLMTVVFSSLLLLSSTAFAVPTQLPYTGFLADGGGPYTGKVTVQVDLFAQAAAGTAFWSYKYVDVPVAEGYFTVVLGGGSSPLLDAGLLPAAGAWLEFSVNGTKLTGRQMLSSVPFALRSQVCEFASALNELGYTDLKTQLPTKLSSWDQNSSDDLTLTQTDTRYYLKSELDSGKMDGRYYTEAEVDKKINDAVAAAVAGIQKQLGCPADMVRVGDFCIDRVEASLWARVDGAAVDCELLQKAVDTVLDSTGAWKWSTADWMAWYKAVHATCLAGGPKPDLCQYRQYGTPPACSSGATCDDYPGTFPDTGAWTKALYSCAIRGVGPSRSMTWFQAQQACVASGRALCSNADWQAAAVGTPDPTGADPDNDTEPCNIWDKSKPKDALWAELNQTIKTGSAPLCKSVHGVYDMAGNVWEWVDLWGQAGRTSLDTGTTKFTSGKLAEPWPPAYNNDGTWGINGEGDDGSVYKAGLPASLIRGGAWDGGSVAGVFSASMHYSPSFFQVGVGSRCCKR